MDLLAGLVPGKSGYERVRFEDIGDYCAERWSGERAPVLGTESRERQVIRKAYIPKPNERRGPAGTAAIRGRLAIVTPCRV